jgi:hypothetical protein
MRGRATSIPGSLTLCALSLLACLSLTSAAQQSAPSSTMVRPQRLATRALQIAPPVPYRVVFTLTQKEAGKLEQSRTFELSFDSDSPGTEMTTGRRVTLAVGGSPAGTVTYNIGVTIHARLVQEPAGVELQSTIEQTSLAPGVAGKEPQVHQANLTTATLMPEGQPVLLGALDDLDSSRHFEVTATVHRRL